MWPTSSCFSAGLNVAHLNLLKWDCSLLLISRSESNKFKLGRLDNIFLLELNSNFESLLTEFLKMTEIGGVEGDRGGASMSPLYNNRRLVP